MAVGLLGRVLLGFAFVGLTALGVVVYLAFSARPVAGTLAPTAVPIAALPSPAVATAQPSLSAAVPAPPMPAPSPDTRYVVAGTNGLGLMVRSAPETGTRISAWPDGSILREVGPSRVIAGREWHAVADPSGAEGWAVADFLRLLPAAPTPPPSPSPTVRPAATPEPPSRALASVTVSAYREGGQVVVEGKVRNAGDEPLRALWVSVRWYDGSGALIKEQTQPVMADPFLPGRTAAFRVAAGDQPDIAQYSLGFNLLRGEAVPLLP